MGVKQSGPGFNAVKARMAAALNRAAEAGALVGANHAQVLLRRHKSSSPAGRGRASYASSRPGEPPGYRQGNLYRSIAYTPGENGRARYGTNVKYAKALEFGAVVTPKNAMALAIPLTGEAVTALMRAGGKTRAIPNLVPVETRNGNLLLVKINKARRGKYARGESWTAMFLITKRSVIRPRPWAARSLKESKRAITAKMRDVLRKAMTGGNP